MNAVDSHIHWFPHSFYKFLAARTEVPRTEREGDHWRYINGLRSVRMWPEWFDLDMQFETAAKTGLDAVLVSSMGVHSDLDGLPADAAREGARIVNEEWSAAQRRYRGKFFGIAAVPLADTGMAIDELEHAIGALDLRGVSLPGSINGEPIDAPRLEPFYARVEELGVPIFIHPTDGAFVDAMAGEGYGNAVYKSLGRVVDSSVGVLPYAAGRLDKNARVPDLAQ